jgi:hypothetical protein
MTAARARRPWTDDDSEELRTRHAAGETLYGISKAMRRSQQTVHKYAKRLHLDWDRAATAKATEAVVVDNRARRAELEQRLLAEAAAELATIREGMEVGQFAGADGEWKHAWVDKPSPSDRKAIAQTTSTLLTAANRLAELVSDGRELSAVDAWVKAMTSGNR